MASAIFAKFGVFKSVPCLRGAGRFDVDRRRACHKDHGNG